MTDPSRITPSNAAGPDQTTAPSPAGVVGAARLAPAGRYELLDEIAHGGMGVVYRAVDTVLSREVAVKVLSDRFGPDTAAARRFADEAHIAAQLQHPAVPPVHDLGALPDGRPFLAMKLIEGQTLDALLDAGPTWPTTAAASWPSSSRSVRRWPTPTPTG